MSDTTVIINPRKLFLDGWAKWEGTRFRYGCCEIGKGTDCIRGILSEAKKLGIVRNGYNPKHLPPDWFEFVPEKFSVNAFHDQLALFVYEIPQKDAKPGDVVSFSVTNSKNIKVECHIGILYPEDKFLHTKPYGKVCYQSLKGYPGLHKYYRIKGF